jgi:gluconate 2-dehydrogenase gamma chain
MEWKRALMTRRRFLLRSAGAGLTALFPAVDLQASSDLTDAQRWTVLDAVQQHLFPAEPDAPGAREIQALDYLRFVVADEGLGEEDRQFILKGAGWLEDMALKLTQHSFVNLQEVEREQVLRQIEGSDAGENWISTILLYLFEALLTDPIYGGNPDGIGWKWLGLQPGFPRPTSENRYGVLGHG